MDKGMYSSIQGRESQKRSVTSPNSDDMVRPATLEIKCLKASDSFTKL